MMTCEREVDGESIAHSVQSIRVKDTADGTVSEPFALDPVLDEKLSPHGEECACRECEAAAVTLAEHEMAATGIPKEHVETLTSKRTRRRT